MHTPDQQQESHVHRNAERQEPAEQSGENLASQLGNAAIGRIVASPSVQRSGATGAQQLDESVARAIEDRRGKGSPLSEPVRRDMEGALGHDLSDVRVHTDDTAHQLNETVSARAFTAGTDVFFKQGTYDPASSSGRQLLGHELTHVVQQRTGTSGLQPGEVSDPSDSAEQHADSVGQHLSQAPAQPAAVARVTEDEELMQRSVDPTAVQRMGGEPDELDEAE